MCFLIPTTENYHTERQTDRFPRSVFLDMDGVPIAIFVALAANQNASCWLQVHTFAENGEPFPSTTAGQGRGPLVSLTQQRSNILGSSFLFNVGTDTGNIFNTDFAPNAICLPLACSNFIIATLEAREDSSLGSPSLLPVNDLKGMYSMSCSVPVDVGAVFTWNELFIPLQITNAPTPFYQDFGTCQVNAQKQNPNEGDFFSFKIQQVIDVPQPNEFCFIKIQIIKDCFHDIEVTVTSTDPRISTIHNRTTFTVQHIPRVATCDETTATFRSVCFPFMSGDLTELFVIPVPTSGQTMFCQLTGRSKIINTEIILDITNNTHLVLTSNNLKTSDYNDPNLGIYFDKGSAMVVEGRCNAGTGNKTYCDTLNIETGVAATFDCVQNVETLNVSSSKTSVCSRVNMTEAEMTSTCGNDVITHVLSSESTGKVTITLATTSRVLFSPPNHNATTVTVSLSVLGIIILGVIVIVLVLFCVLQKRKQQHVESSR